MWLMFSAPLGLAFGAVTWAALRGRGGFSGLMLFVVLGAIAGFVGSLAAEAVAGYQGDALSGAGAVGGALAASVFIALGFGAEPIGTPVDD